MEEKSLHPQGFSWCSPVYVIGRVKQDKLIAVDSHQIFVHKLCLRSSSRFFVHLIAAEIPHLERQGEYSMKNIFLFLAKIWLRKK